MAKRRVKAHTRKDGTRVKSHLRKVPNGRKKSSGRGRKGRRN